MKKFLISNKIELDYVIQEIQKLFATDGAISVDIKTLKNKRTDKQLNYYWICIRYITEAMNNEGNNYTEDQVSDEMKKMFYFDIIDFAGKKTKSLKSISSKSETDKKEMADFITNIIVWCNDMEIKLPECDQDYNLY